MENFLLPSKIEFQEGANPNAGSIVVSPCYHGYGTTLGNAYRRVLLSSLPGSAVEHFKIKGVQHEFSAIEGVQEDIVEIMLNVKQLALKVFSDELVTLTISKKGPGVVTAGDIESNAQVEIINKDLVLATLTKNKTFEMEIVVGRGRGYKPVEEKNRQNYDLGTMVVDSVYAPVKDVGYHVEFTRVGDITNFEKLTLNIETNGTITPREAIRQATQILMDHFTIILNGVQEEEIVPAPMLMDESVNVESSEEDEDNTEDVKEKKSKTKKTKKNK